MTVQSRHKYSDLRIRVSIWYHSSWISVDSNSLPLSSLLARSSHLPALDGMRALAIGVVIVYHLGTVFFPVYHVPGDLGVSFFFVLSGFLITWLLLKERDRRVLAIHISGQLVEDFAEGQVGITNTRKSNAVTLRHQHL